LDELEEFLLQGEWHLDVGCTTAARRLDGATVGVYVAQARWAIAEVSFELQARFLGQFALCVVEEQLFRVAAPKAAEVQDSIQDRANLHRSFDARNRRKVSRLMGFDTES
jgi:hypothetical protein